MSYQALNFGTVVNDGTGDTLPVAADKINDNFVEIYTLLGDGTSLSSGISATATVVTLTAPTISGVVGGTITSATITTLTGTTFNAGTLALAAGSITDSSGAISFGNENLTTTGSVTAASLDISGNVDIDGTLETDALTIDGVSLAETISDTVGAMVSSNTETNITVTYDDADNTLDFVIGTLNQSTSGNAAHCYCTGNCYELFTVYPLTVLQILTLLKLYKIQLGICLVLTQRQILLQHIRIQMAP